MRLALIIYGSIDTISGGYLYDRMLVQHLRNHGHSVEIISLPWRSYPAHLADNLSHRWRERLAALNVDIIIQDELNHPSLAWVNGWLDSDANGFCGQARTPAIEEETSRLWSQFS